MTEKLALYFGYGLNHDGGHFLHSLEHRLSLHNPEHDVPGFPWTMRLLDTGLLENRKVPDEPDGRVHWTVSRDLPDGGCWHAFFWWDRSGDKRGNSNSGLYVRGFECSQAREAFTFACEQWPGVVARQKFPLVLVSLDGKPWGVSNG